MVELYPKFQFKLKILDIELAFMIIIKAKRSRNYTDLANNDILIGIILDKFIINLVL